MKKLTLLALHIFLLTHPLEASSSRFTKVIQKLWTNHYIRCAATGISCGAALTYFLQQYHKQQADESLASLRKHLSEQQTLQAALHNIGATGRLTAIPDSPFYHFELPTGSFTVEQLTLADALQCSLEKPIYACVSNAPANQEARLGSLYHIEAPSSSSQKCYQLFMAYKISSKGKAPISTHSFHSSNFPFYKIIGFTPA